MDEILLMTNQKSDLPWLSDSNVDLLNSDTIVDEYVKKLSTHGFEGTMTGATRVDSGSAIDHVFFRERESS